MVIICLLSIGITKTEAQWTQARTTDLHSGDVSCIAICGKNSLAGTWGDGIFLSTDDGANWSQVKSGFNDIDINALSTDGSNSIAATNGGVFFSKDQGLTWAKGSGLTNNFVMSLTVVNKIFFAGTFGAGVFRSTDGGENWTQVGPGVTNGWIFSLAATGPKVFAGTREGLFVSKNKGMSWRHIYSWYTRYEDKCDCGKRKRCDCGGSRLCPGLHKSGIKLESCDFRIIGTRHSYNFSPRANHLDGNQQRSVSLKR